MLATLNQGVLLRVQLQLGNHGDRAADVEIWLAERYPHIDGHCWSAPGLTIAMTMPRHDYDSLGTWLARFHEATGPVDLAFEILSECFTDLELPASTVLSVHVTDG